MKFGAWAKPLGGDDRTARTSNKNFYLILIIAMIGMTKDIYAS
jgi:hypothetical protein